MTAAELVENIRRSGGRVYRMVEPPLVFVITEKMALAEKLVGLGAHAFRPNYIQAEDLGPWGGYERARGGSLNWDLYIHSIPVEGEQTVWEAATQPRHLKAVES